MLNAAPVRPEICGCAAPPRWRCPDCAAATEFLACRWACLQRHRRRRHGDTEPLLVRARREQAASNAAGADNQRTFADHRARLTALLRVLQRGEGLCVLGAGNADDLELATLVRDFGEVHLVDLDGAALRRARARLPARFAARVVLHEEVDLTGLLDGLERRGDDEGALERAASRAPELIAGGLGRTFDLVLSACVLSQLCAPFTRSLARTGAQWRAFLAAIGQAHFELMVRLLRPGGNGVALGDLYLGPATGGPAVVRWADLDDRGVAALRGGVMRLRDPQFLAELLAAPPLVDRVTGARLTEPWSWTVEGARMLVYAVLFQRAEG